MTTTEMATGAGSGAARGLPQEAWLRSDDVVRCLTFMITQPPHAAVNEITVRPVIQEH